MDCPLVSLIVRTCNRRHLLKEALASIANQSWNNLEVIVVNDGGEAIDELVGEQLAGRPFRIENHAVSRGRSAAANSGLALAEGDFIGFLDDDDTIEPDHLQNLVNVALRHRDNPTVVYSAAQGLCRDNQPCHQLALFAEDDVDFSRLLLGNIIPIHAVLFPASLYAGGAAFDESLTLYEDWDFWLQLSRTAEFVFVDKLTANYYVGGGSGVSPMNQDEETKRIAHQHLLEKWFEKLSIDDLLAVSALFHRRQKSANETIGQLKEITSLNEHELEHGEHLRRQLEATIAQEKQLRSQLEEQLFTAQNELNMVYLSRSWRVTSPLRLLMQGGRNVLHRLEFPSLNQKASRGGLFRFRQSLQRIGLTLYRRLPMRWRDSVVFLAFRVAGPLFAGERHYESWKQARCGVLGSLPQTFESATVAMLDIGQIAPLSGEMSKRVAIHIHMFYADLADEFAGYLQNMPCAYDLYVSVPDNSSAETCYNAFSVLPDLGALRIEVVPNRGRDIAPFFTKFGASLSQYDYVAHIHSKKSLYNEGRTSGWREYLLDALFGNRQQLQRIFELLSGPGQVGIVYPQNYWQLPYMANTWLANRAQAQALAPRFGLDPIPSGYFDFPAGSMFWARTEALRPLFNSGLSLDEFPEEQGQTDGTLAHCLERFLVLSARKSGFHAIVLQDKLVPSWSRWRFEQFLARDKAGFIDMVGAGEVKLIVFDIFDTLLQRNLLDPEDLKALVAMRVEGEAGRVYARWRVEAESRARLRKGSDVDMGDIFLMLQELSGLPPEQVLTLRQLEEDMERSSLAPRPDGVSLLQAAVASGKRVILASDMYLEKPFVESLLADCGVTGWQALYLSSAIGVRKDSGELYRYILDREQYAPQNVVVVGDNERSDFQIPIDMGMLTYHLLRPVELARALPRFSSFVEEALDAREQNTRLTIGLIVRENFHSVFYSAFSPAVLASTNPFGIGYAVLGPVVLGFAQWLGRQAVADKMQRLYFLSREGKFMLKVYERWREAEPLAPPASYLILSRRAVTVPMVETIEDAVRIARVKYYPNRLENFLLARYGLELTGQEWEDLYRKGVWKKGRLLEVDGGRVEHLMPFLRAVLEHLKERARAERRSLHAYLESQGLTGDGRFAVVDVGYSGTIQNCLNALLGRPLHGYYMATWEGATEVATRYGVEAKGCFGTLLQSGIDIHPLLQESFTLEKLLSSDDPQIVSYHLSQDGPQGLFRPLTDGEMSAREMRHALQTGAMKFVNDALHAKDHLHRDFEVPVELALKIFARFVENPGPIEREFLSDILLDDYYCGRDLVD